MASQSSAPAETAARAILSPQLRNVDALSASSREASDRAGVAKTDLYLEEGDVKELRELWTKLDTLVLRAKENG